MLLVSLDAQGTGGGPVNVRGCGKWKLVFLFAEGRQRTVVLSPRLYLMTQMVDGGGTHIMLNRN